MITTTTPARRASAIALLAAALGAPAAAQTIVGEVRSEEASVKGSVVLVGNTAQLLSGSSVNAGASHASVRLTRGGELRVCPQTALTVTTSTGAKDLMLSLNTGAVETHYSLTTSADTVVTPDFRILLAGPGTFHFAIAADTRGNTCVKALKGNTSSVIVTELMGDGVYQVRASEQVFFRDGRVNKPTDLVPPDCGCADQPPAPVSYRAEVAKPAAPGVANKPAVKPGEIVSETKPGSAEAVIAEHWQRPPRDLSQLAPTEPLPPVRPEDIHVQVDAPFVFRARPEPVPDPPTVARLSLATIPMLAVTEPQPFRAPEVKNAQLAAGVPQVKAKPGVWRRIGGFFARIFGSPRKQQQ